MTSGSAKPRSIPRFAFGANWANYLGTLDEARVGAAVHSLTDMLGVGTLTGRSFLDAGSGSGLFSLAARRLGARVHSFDYDGDSVACTASLRAQFFPEDTRPETTQWTVEQGSVLDSDYLKRLGTFDVVYSWGVLHHTGDLWRALALACDMVAPGGRLFVAIYNRQRRSATLFNTTLKRTYVASPRPVRRALEAGYAAAIAPLEVAAALVARRSPVAPFREYRTLRGMSWWHDMVDWVGGYPYESARPEEVFDFCRERGYTLQRLVTVGGANGCNEFVFARTDG